MLLIGRTMTAEEAHRIGLCERVVGLGEARTAAEQLAREMAAHPQAALRADGPSVRGQHGRALGAALREERAGGVRVLERELPRLLERVGK